MAIRYSGDVEVRVQYARGVYRGSVRSPGFRGRETVTENEVLGSRLGGLRRRQGPTDPESYDRAALLILRKAEAAGRKAGIPLYTTGKGQRIQIRRTFQSPCPYRS